eukprot:930927_1
MRVEANLNSFDIYWNNEYLFTYTDNNAAGVGPYYNGSVGLSGYYASATYHSVRITFPSDNYLYTVSPTSSTSAPSATPTTVNPTTNNPTTRIPTTNQPTTAIPTTNMPTTVAPTTNNPTSKQPTTNNPTTNNPTTINPTTNTPT